jgi:hypothetical protein
MDNILYQKYLYYKGKYIALKSQLSNQMYGGKPKSSKSKRAQKAYHRDRKPITYIDIMTKEMDMQIQLSDEEKIDSVLKKHFSNISKLVCLDFHGVTDLFDNNEKIPTNLPKCVVSFIGGKQETIDTTKATLIPRIKSGELIAGIIVYNKDRMPVCGTKGWIISKIKTKCNIDKIIFIDDSMKNIECVNNVKDPNITTHYIDKNLKGDQNPKQQLIRLLDRL